MHDVCTEYEIKHIASAMRSNGLRAAGYRYIMLDDCWAATLRTASGQVCEDVLKTIDFVLKTMNIVLKTMEFSSLLTDRDSRAATVHWPCSRRGCMKTETSCWGCTLQPGTRPAPLVAAASRASQTRAGCLAVATA